MKFWKPCKKCIVSSICNHECLLFKEYISTKKILFILQYVLLASMPILLGTLLFDRWLCLHPLILIAFIICFIPLVLIVVRIGERQIENAKPGP
jgi:hypothetical protein